MTMPIEAPEACRPLRADAARNRELILDTAVVVFAEQGLDAGYDEIARRAGIGVGTVYRRFPQREELVRALFESRIDEIAAIADEAIAHPDPWDGLVQFLERAAERQVVDRGLKEAMVRTISPDAHSAIGRERLGPLIDRLVQRARAAGVLRHDVAATDLGLQLLLLTSISTPEEPDLWRRYLALLLEGLRARPEQDPLPMAAPEEATLHELMCSVRSRLP